MQLTKHIEQGRLIYLDKNEDINTLGSLSVGENDYYKWLNIGDVVQSVMQSSLAQYRAALPKFSPKLKDYNNQTESKKLSNFNT